ncbi:MAG: transglycosylase domain-containing protein [Candidatus Peregrinibacteria bacterium]|nr:transglycosylase domain-containing protein [Candidatus Peregrinibacteria bacterium]MDZ4244636.1 transglycosylase domain-containing protein [Candidatus Gracilibacteria bacterium]
MNNNFETKKIGATKGEAKKNSDSLLKSFPKKLKWKKIFIPESLNWRTFGNKNRRDVNIKKWILLICLGGPLFGIVLFFLMVVYFSIGLPDVKNLDQYRESQSTFIYDRNGEELYAIHGDENRESIKLFDRENPAFKKGKCRKEADLCTTSDGYKYIVLATIAIEDDRFYDHNGFDAERLLKAIVSQFLPTVRARGGSTITQQYIKNTLLSPERTISRKFRELILAVKLENVFNKEEIMELYLNSIPYGSNAYGIELAAKTYFNKEAKDLTLAEATILASLPNAPTRYSPYGDYRYPKLLKTFSEKELKRGNIESESDLNNEFIRGLLGTVVYLDQSIAIEAATKEGEAAEAVSEDTAPENEEVVRKLRSTPLTAKLGPNVIYIKGRTDLVLQRMTDLGYITAEKSQSALEESWNKEFTRARENILAPHFVLYIKQVLENQYGKEVLEQGGLKVYTTLDNELQKLAEEAIQERHEFNITNYDAGNAALMAFDRSTGEVLAMVGSADYFDEDIDGSVNMATSYIQPGSSFKPFVYALAFARGLLQPATVLYDVPTKFGGEQHVVDNYDGLFTGPIPVRRALAQSRNVTAVKTYFLIGVQEPIVELAEKMGIEFLDGATEHGSSLALGSAEVKFSSLVEGFMTMANYGVHKDPIMILKIENNEGEILEEIEVAKVRESDPPVEFGNIIGEEIELDGPDNLTELTPEPIPEFDPPSNPSSVSNEEFALDPQAAYLITNILSDTTNRLGPNLTIPGWPNAAKTGTSNKRFDNGTPDFRGDDKILPSNTLAMGYTNEIVAGVWAGNTDGSVMRWNANGYDTAAPMWKKFMVGAHEYLAKEKGLTPTSFQTPYGITKVSVSSASGLLANPESTPEESIVEDLFASYAIPTQVEDKFMKVAIDSKTKKLWTEHCPIQNKVERDMELHETLFGDFPGWQAGVDTWAEENDMLIPKEVCDDDYQREFEVDPTITILAPFDFGEVPFKPFQVYVYATSPNGISNVEFYLGDQLQFQDKAAPYIGSIRPPVTAANGSKRNITVRAFDSYGFSKDATIEVRFDDRLGKIEKPEGFDQLYTTTPATE